MRALLIVTEDATEPSGDVSAAVETPGTRRLDDERNQATTPPFQRKERCLPVSESGEKGMYPMGRRRFELRLRPPEGRRIPSYPTGPHLSLMTGPCLTVVIRRLPGAVGQYCA